MGGDGGLALSVGGIAVAAERVRARPRAGGVDDGAGDDPAGVAVCVTDVDGEGLVLAAGVDDAVAALPGDAGDGGAVVDAVTEGVGERLQVLPRPLGSGRVATRVGLVPPVLGQEATSGRVDQFGPAREEPDVSPGRDGRCSPLPSLEHERLESALEKVRGCGETDRAGTDDHDGLRRAWR